MITQVNKYLARNVFLRRAIDYTYFLTLLSKL